MPLPHTLLAFGWQSPVPVVLGIVPSGSGAVWAGRDWSWAEGLLVLLLAGLLAAVLWWWRRRSGARGLPSPVDANGQMARLIERAGCLLWEAKVDLRGAEWKWTITTYRSALSERLFGQRSPPSEIGLWHKLVSSGQQEEMNRRARDAMHRGDGGYEQQFNLQVGDRQFWLHENVSIAPAGPGQFWLVGLVMDVTAQHLAEQASRASEGQLQQLMTHANGMLWQATVDCDERGEFHWEFFLPKSELYRKLVGEDQDKKAVMPWGPVNVPEFPELEERSHHAMRTGLPGYEQVFRVNKDRQTLWMHEQVAITPLGPRRWKLEGVVMDITAERAAEEARRNSEERLRNLLARADCLLWEATMSLADWKWNSQALDSQFSRRLFGPPVAGSTAGLWTRFNIPEREEMDRRSRAALTEGRSGYEQIFHIARDDGSAIWIQESVTITQIGPDHYSLVGVATDITRQHSAERELAAEKERLAVTLRAMAEAVITTDVSGRVLFLNAAAAALTEWTPQGAIGRPVAEVCRFESNPSGVPVDVPLERVTQGDTVAELPPQTRLVTRDGRKRVVEGCCAPIHSPDSTVTGTVLVFRDVTEQDRLEQELVRATRLESVGILAGGIAHDFNNILTGVMGNLTLAQMELDSPTELVERLQEAEKATLRARDLTQQLLTFAKGGDPVRAAVNLDAILHETATFALHGSNVKAIFDIAADLWAADADKGQIGRVVQNLVINAVQAMPAGGMLRLTARNDTVGLPVPAPALKPGNFVRIEVADTGEGIKPDNLGRVFDPYFTTKLHGSGLGLAAVYSIVRKHGGAIEVESQVGRGTTFRLWLPASPGHKTETKPPAPPKPVQFRGRVLFMDDEEIIRKMAIQMLRALGFEVDCAVEGKEAVEIYRAAHARGEPHVLVIMDLTVPGGYGGREAIAELRAIDPHVRAIVSSGYSSDPVLANYRAHGFCGVLAKPYQLEDFLNAIREALAG
jgi:PAS domain S-box-containing protein